MRDITTEKVISDNIVIEEIKSKILNSFTHELCSPLNGLIGMIDSIFFLIDKSNLDWDKIDKDELI